MRIVLVHNHYVHPGGEDEVFAAEADVLRSHGDQVVTYTLHNSRIASMGKMDLARSTIWNRQVFSELTELIRQFGPDLVHFHNTFPLVSPAAYVATQRLGVPVVQTLHNFRLLCVNGLLLRNNQPCEDCLGRAVAWPGVLHRCYRQSRGASAGVAAMVAVHRWRGTWRSAVDTYIALSEFARIKFMAGGLPEDRVVVKPNFLPTDPGIGRHGGRFALYVGRLSPEKGVAALVQLWGTLRAPLPLRMIGTGPLSSLSADSPPNVEWLGWQPREHVLAAMKDACFLVFPSRWYEGFPMVLLEAMATGLPIIASRLGSVPEILREGSLGVLVTPGSPEHWTRTLHWATHHPDELAAIGQRGRHAYEAEYSSDVGYQRLIEVYRRTVDRTRGHARSRAQQ